MCRTPGHQPAMPETEAIFQFFCASNADGLPHPDVPARNVTNTQRILMPDMPCEDSDARHPHNRSVRRGPRLQTG